MSGGEELVKESHFRPWCAKGSGAGKVFPRIQGAQKGFIPGQIQHGLTEFGATGLEVRAAVQPMGDNLPSGATGQVKELPYHPIQPAGVELPPPGGSDWPEPLEEKFIATDV